jgi:hypothetical protein
MKDEELQLLIDLLRVFDLPLRMGGGGIIGVCVCVCMSLSVFSVVHARTVSLLRIFFAN